MSNPTFPPQGGNFPPAPTGGPGMGMQSPGGHPGIPNPPGHPDESAKGKKGKSKKGDDGGPKTKRDLKVQKVGAIAFAIIVIVLVFVSLGSGDGEKAYVVRAKGPIQPLTVPTAGKLEAVEVPADLVEDGAYTGSDGDKVLKKALADMKGLQTSSFIAKGEQLHPEDFYNAEAADTRDLEPNERLVSFPALVPYSTGGILRAGDSVDVAATVNLGGNETVTNVVVYDAEVVSVRADESVYNDAANSQSGDGTNTKGEDLLPGDPIPGIYVVRVTIDESIILASAGQSADLTLFLRGAEASSDPTSAVKLADIICGPNNPTCAAQVAEAGEPTEEVVGQDTPVQPGE